METKSPAISGARTQERSAHEAGHLIISDHIFSDDVNFVVQFATIITSSDSGGGVSWQFADHENDETRVKLCAMLLAGYFYERALNPNTPARILKIHASEDYRVIDSEGLAPYIEPALALLEATAETAFPLVKLVANELGRRRTFFTGESRLVVEKWRLRLRGDDNWSAVNAEIQAYRATRAFSDPPDSWGARGQWYESVDEWRRRS